MFGTLSHGSFLAVLGANMFNAAGIGLVFSINLYFNTFFWEFGSRQIAMFTGSSLIAATCAFAAAPRLSRKFGKRNSAMCLILSALFFMCTPIVLRLMGSFPANGAPALFPLLFVLQIFSVGMAVSGAILMSSMIADVVEDSELRTGRRSEGLFFAAAAFVNKSVTGIGIFTSGALLSAIGFPDDAKPGEVSADVVRNLGLVVAPTLTVVFGAAVLCLTRYRITRASHEASLRKLEAASDLIAEPDTRGPHTRPV